MVTEQMTQSLALAAAPINPASISVGTADSGGIDMKQFRRAAFVLNVGAFGTSATVDMKLQESTDNVTFTDLAGTGVAITQLTAGGGDDRLATLEARADQLSSGKRYLRARVTVGTADTILCCIPLGGVASPWK